MKSLSTVFKPGLFEGKVSYVPISALDSMRWQVALVTGGGTGIGFRVAKELLALGARVVIASRKVDVLNKAAAELNSFLSGKEPRCFAVECNIRSLESIQQCIERCVKLVGTIDMLVNNGGGASDSPLIRAMCFVSLGQFIAPASAVGEKGWRSVIDTNLTGTFLMSQTVYNQVFEPQGSGGMESQ
jgi:NAD(P)-dependent dehydrogenase (short-subunit alcohol dehydrogenase family)